MSKVLDWDEANAALQRAAKAGIGESAVEHSGRFDLDRRYIEALGEDDGKIVIALLCDYLELRKVWQIYSDFFESSQEVVDTLNWASPASFGVVQMELHNSIIIRLHRFFDKAKGSLSFDRLNRNSKLKSIQPSIEKARSAVTDNISNWRKERVAHRTLSVLIQKTPPTAVKLSGDELKDAVDAIGKALAAIHGTCFDSELAWPRQTGLTSDLMRILRDAHERKVATKRELGLKI